ncbi:MAG: hypothetical protein IPK31_09915 [Chitinophagaceae bacterium]|nr:hypothetical protein [Chitinophagaceae bacterium]
MKPKLFFTLSFLTLLHFAQAQKLSKEATHEISKKANKGYLYEPKVDEAKKKSHLLT